MKHIHADPYLPLVTSSSTNKRCGIRVCCWHSLDIYIDDLFFSDVRKHTLF